MEALLSGFTLGIFVVLLVIGLLKLSERIREFKWTVNASSNSIAQLFNESKMHGEMAVALKQRQDSLERNEREYLTAIARLATRYSELDAVVRALDQRTMACCDKCGPDPDLVIYPKKKATK